MSIRLVLPNWISHLISNIICCLSDGQVRIGHSGTISIGGQVGWTTLADGRYKYDVQENIPGLDFISQLRPVSYRLDIPGLSHDLQESGEDVSTRGPQKAEMTFTGFIAQEVESVAATTGYEFSGVDAPKNASDFYGLRYAEFVVPLVKAVQELSAQNAELQEQLIMMQTQINELKAHVR